MIHDDCRWSSSGVIVVKGCRCVAAGVLLIFLPNLVA